jgi:hypothetical protein
MRAVFALGLAVFLMPSLASASDTKWLYMTTSGHVADYASSVWFSQNGSPCQELNPLARHADGTFDARKGAIGVAATVAIEWAVLHFTAKSKSENVRTIGKAVTIGAGAAGFGQAAINVASCRR